MDKRLIAQGAPRPSEWIDEYLKRLAQELGSTDLSFERILRKSGLRELLEAGEASEEILESIDAHVSHGGPTKADAQKAILQYRAAKAALLAPEGKAAP